MTQEPITKYVATLRFEEPAFLKLEMPDGSNPVDVDIYVARRMLEEAYKLPSEEQRWQHILNWLQERLKSNGRPLAESMALEFNEVINRLVNELNSVRSKKSLQIASSLISTPESQTATGTGQ